MIFTTLVHFVSRVCGWASGEKAHVGLERRNRHDVACDACARPMALTGGAADDGGMPPASRLHTKPSQP